MGHLGLGSGASSWLGLPLLPHAPSPSSRLALHPLYLDRVLIHLQL
jgi:hypothetical protein